MSTKFRLPGSERAPIPGAKRLGAVDPGDEVGVTLLLRRRPDAPELPGLDDWAATPPGDRRFVARAEFARDHASDDVDVTAVCQFLAAHGLRVVERHAGRNRVSAVGSAADIEAAFGVTLHNYRAARYPDTTRAKHLLGSAAGDQQEHRGFEGAVHLPAELADVVTAVLGLDNRRLGAPAGTTGDPAGAASLLSATVASLYNFPNLDASGETIGLFADASGGAFFQVSDITAAINNQPAGYRTQPTVNAIGLTVGTTTYSNGTPSASSNYAAEITQDISTAAAVAQGVTINVYLTDDTEAGWEAFLSRAIVPNAGERAPSALSASWVMTFQDDTGTIGDPAHSGSTANVLSGLLQRAAAAGITVFLPIGDWGSDDTVQDGKCHVPYPNSDPWATSCGGTIIGSVTGTPPAFQEVVWSDANSASAFGSSTGDFGSTGGGVSDTFAVPDYQTAAGVAQASKNDNAIRRGLPDIAGMVALSGFQVAGSGYSFTGTSCVAPLYAGLAACLNAALGQPIGFLNPTIYQHAADVCRDITSGTNDSADPAPSGGSPAPFYTAGNGWDACSGWGVVDGTKLLTTLIATKITPTLQFWMTKSTFGRDEVTDTLTWPNAFSVVLDGVAPYQFAASGLPTVGLSGDFESITGVTVTPHPPRWQNAGAQYSPQRLEFPFDIAFTTASLADFPAAGDVAQKTLFAVTNAGGTVLAAETLVELVGGEDPYFTNIDPALDNVFWLSQDLRVFTVTPGLNASPLAGTGTPPALTPASNTALDAAAGYAYARAAVEYLNAHYSDPNGVDPFGSVVPDQSGEASGDSSVTPTTPHAGGTAFTNYNFAVARVRLRGALNAHADDVRVFFRMFLTQTNDTDYLPDTTYRSDLDAGHPRSPLVGAADVSIPFFATGTQTTQSDYVTHGVNNRTVTIGSGDATWAYFGCFLNVYDPANVIDGRSVQERLVGTHHCLVAQIAYDEAPIVNQGGVTMSPENSDKLAQRNLQVTTSDNPGPPSAHRVPQTFDLRPSRVLGGGIGHDTNLPDELVVDWGRTPVGATASIFWPRVDAAEVIALADRLYGSHTLRVVDAHTVGLTVIDGTTYVPIPAGASENLAGLLTIDLPTTVHAGDTYDVVLRRVAWRASEREVATHQLTTEDAAGRDGEKGTVSRAWRYVVGTFQVRIPVGTAHTLLAPEVNTLAIMKWRLSRTPTSDRWYPVLRKYVEYLSGRVDGLGGDAAKVPASVQGWPVRDAEPGRPIGSAGAIGKVDGIVFDRFGDFEGFVLLTEDGVRRAYRSTEREIESLIRFAWLDRVVIEVVSAPHTPEIPAAVVLLRAPKRVDW